MSKSVADRVRELEDNYRELSKAARRVIEKWSTGELAEAVNSLEQLLDKQDGQ